MTRHIIFDMGQVLVGYVGDLVCQKCTKDEQERKEVGTSVLVFPEWILLGMGVILKEEAPKKMRGRLDTEHKRNIATRCFWHWREYNMRPKEGTEQMVRWPKSMGHGICLYSNASVYLLTCYKEVIPAIDCFDGVSPSTDVQCLKPQRKMYQCLFNRFRLRPEECSFADDPSLNIEETRRCGVDGYCPEDGDVGKLKEVLDSLNRQQLHFNGK